jgi:hypothetical protein
MCCRNDDEFHMNFVLKGIQPPMDTNQHGLLPQLENWSSKNEEMSCVSIRATSRLF